MRIDPALGQTASTSALQKETVGSTGLLYYRYRTNIFQVVIVESLQPLENNPDTASIIDPNKLLGLANQ